MNKAKFVGVAIVVVGASVAATLVSTTFFRPSDNVVSFHYNGAAGQIYPTSNLDSSISAKFGETFIVQLSSNPGSTGYDWKVTTNSGIQYLNYTVVSTGSMPGGPQIRNYFFRAVQTGSQTITLQDQRQFAPYDVHATINIRVTVS